MDSQAQFCPNPRCPARGRTGQGNIKVHSYPQRRYRCTICRRTFAATTGTPFYRLHKDPVVFVCVVTLLAYGCPIPAIVVAFGLDERTVGAWQDRAGGHARAVHHHFLRTAVADLLHVQADELCGKIAGGRCWLAMALAVPYRLWLGGVVSPVRDLRLIQHLVDLVRLAWTPGRTLLICVDGLASYVTAFWRALRDDEVARPIACPVESYWARWSRITAAGASWGSSGVRSGVALGGSTECYSGPGRAGRSTPRTSSGSTPRSVAGRRA